MLETGYFILLHLNSSRFKGGICQITGLDWKHCVGGRQRNTNWKEQSTSMKKTTLLILIRELDWDSRKRWEWVKIQVLTFIWKI